MFQKNGFKGDARTATGRITQLANVVTLKFRNTDRVHSFMNSPDEVLGNKTPQETAAESTEGLIMVLQRLARMEL